MAHVAPATGTPVHLQLLVNPRRGLLQNGSSPMPLPPDLEDPTAGLYVTSSASPVTNAAGLVVLGGSQQPISSRAYGYGSQGAYSYGTYGPAASSSGGLGPVFLAPETSTELIGQSGQLPNRVGIANPSAVPAGNLNRTLTGAYAG